LENHSGSGGSLGLSKVARSAKDGYTLGLTGPQLVIVPSLYKLPYDVVKDLTTISIVADTILVLVVNADLPVRNVDELVTVAKARENSKTLTFGSQGIGTVNHLSFEMFRSATNINVLHVPYKGSDGFTTALVSGEIDSGVLAVSQVLPWVKSGKLRILSIVSSERTKLLPDTPTMAELGYKDAQLNASLSFIAPTGTPREIIDRLNHEISNTLKMSEVQSVLNASGFIIGDGSNSAAADMKVKQDTKRIANVISRVKLKPE
jgi:tripartite-type tricarboxylate transporter receptor subunit TctC